MKVLYVEDDPQDVALVRHELARHAPEIELDVAPTLEAASASLAGSRRYDLVLTDAHLPDGEGLALLARIREQGWPVAVVLATGGGDEEAVVTALKAGADDFLVKRASYAGHLAKTLRSAHERYWAEVARHARPLRVLYAEDNTADIKLTQRHLGRHAQHIQIDVAHSAAETLRRLSGEPGAGPYDVLLLDYRLPGSTAPEILRELQQAHGAALPVVVVTGQGDEEAALQVLRLGASDYVVKSPGYLYRLPSILESAYHRTQLLREQAALRQSEAKYRTLVEQIPAITYIAGLDERGGLQYVSPQVKAMLGVHPADLLADSGLWRRQVHPADQARMQGRIQRASRQTEPVQTEFRWIRPDGRSVWLRDHACVVRGPAGEPLFVQGIMLDVSEHHQSEAQLAYQAHLLANINDAVLATDASGRLTAWNRAAEALYGWKAEEVLGRLASEVTRTEASVEARTAARGERGSADHFSAESVQYRRDGTRLVVEGTTIALHDETGVLTGFVTVNRDISERKRAEAERDRLLRQVREAHRGLQALSLRLLEVQEAERRHLARELHDEIGQQLTSLKLLLEMNANQPGKPVRSSLAEAQLMLQQLMDVVRELSLSLRPAMLDDLGLLPALLWHLERFTQQTGVQIHFQHSGIEGQRFPTEVETAAYRIIQEALTNVARYAHVDAAQVRLWREAQELRLEVVDQGRGFDARAAQRANRSSGLAGMHERASLLGGMFRIDSSSGRGTRLAAALPVDFDAQKRND